MCAAGATELIQNPNATIKYRFLLWRAKSSTVGLDRLIMEHWMPIRKLEPPRSTTFRWKTLTDRNKSTKRQQDLLSQHGSRSLQYRINRKPRGTLSNSPKLNNKLLISIKALIQNHGRKATDRITSLFWNTSTMTPQQHSMLHAANPVKTNKQAKFRARNSRCRMPKTNMHTFGLLSKRRYLLPPWETNPQSTLFIGFDQLIKEWKGNWTQEQSSNPIIDILG